MRGYTPEDLDRCDRLLDEACDEILRQQATIDQLTELDGLGPACDALDSAMAAAILYEQERVRILEALSRAIPGRGSWGCHPRQVGEGQLGQ